MGKAANAAPQGMGKAAKAAPPAAKPGQKEDDSEAAGTGLLAGLRRKRFGFFLGFLGFCVWIALYSSPCAVKRKVDCGYSGISSGMCRLGAAFRLDPKPEKRAVEVKRKAGTKLGIKLKDGAITSISAGAVQEHNEKLPAGSPDAIRLGDTIKKVNGATGDKLTKALQNTQSETVALDIARAYTSSVAGYVPASWLVGKSLAARALRSAAFERWARSFAMLATSGVATWFMSGYPPASLPVYYLVPSAVLAWQTTRCCYDDQPDRNGDPHCYCSADDDIRTVLTKAWEQTTWKKTEKLFKF